jgi:hypothetical protein
MRGNRVHGLRHSYATIQLYEHHAPIQYVSEQLGHASMKITGDTYGHSCQGTSIALADLLDSADTHALRCATAAQPDTSKIGKYSQYQKHEGDFMRWCRFQAEGKVSYGIVEDDARVIEVSGTPFETYTVTATTYPLSAVKLLVPVIPPTFYAGGLNYPEHVQWWAQYSGTAPRVAAEPGIGYRTNNALIAHEERIVKPKDASEEFQAEGELVAVIGKKARHLSPENALSCVLGYTIGNDVSQRTWQIQDGPYGGQRTRIPSSHGPLDRHGSRPQQPGDHDPH